MRIFFHEFMQKAARITGCSTQMGLAKLLGINRSAVTQAKNRNDVPEKWLLILARQFALPPDWFERDGTETVSLYQHTSETVSPAEELILVPKISAVLCAGGGSLETEGKIREHIPLPYAWARSLGSPERLVFMEIAGDSMEPGICHGDTVLIDQAVREFTFPGVMAVGHGESIYIKRLRKETDGSLLLLSDNQAYSPVSLAGDELDSFRILGKVVCLFRDLTGKTRKETEYV